MTVIIDSKTTLNNGQYVDVLGFKVVRCRSDFVLYMVEYQWDNLVITLLILFRYFYILKCKRRCENSIHV